MIVGITYDLRQEYLALGYSEEQTAEFDRPDTIDAIEASIRRLGHDTVRMGHLRNVVTRLAAGERWDLVFNFTEGMHGFAREAQVPALLEAYGIPFTFSDALVLALTLHKGMTKHVLRDKGIATPDFAVVEDPDDIGAIVLPMPMFAKPVAEGTGKGVSATSRIESRAQLDTVCRELLARFEQPVLVERYLPGREFTVGILGTGRQARALGALEVVLRNNAEAHAYSYVNKEKCEDLVDYVLVSDPLAEEAKLLALRAHRALGCRDASRVDLRADENGRMAVIEVNPVAGLHPQHSDLPILCTAIGMSYDDLLREILASAISRIAKQARP